MKASDLVAELEARFRCVQGPYWAYIGSRELYVMIGAEADPRQSGIMCEKPKPGVVRQSVQQQSYKTEDEACAATLEAFNAYEADWRKTHEGPEPVLFCGIR